LDRMTVALGEIPEIAGTKIDDFGYTLGVDNRNLAVAIDDVSPLGRIVPMHLAGATRIHKQMRARDIGGDRKSAGGDFTRPTAGCCLDRSLVERSREDDRVAGL